MEEILSPLDNLNLGQLKKIKKQLDTRITEFEDHQKQQKIQETVFKEGYAISSNDYDLKDLKKIRLPYYVELTCFDKDDKSDVKIDGVHHTQPTWVGYLGCDYKPSGKEDFDDLDDWDYSDWDDPATGKGSITLYLYFKGEKCPKNGTTVKIIEEDGEINTWTIKDDNIYCDNQVVDLVENWDDYSVYIVDRDPDDDDNS